MRKYAEYMLRHAARGTGNITAVNHATFALFNNSTSGRFLVVDDWSWDDTTSTANFMSTYSRTRLTGSAGTAVTVFPESGAVPGLIDVSDQAVQLTADGQFKGPTNVDRYWPHEFPYAVVPPNWSFVLQDFNGAHSVQVNFWWIALFPLEFEYLYGEAPEL